VSSPVGALDSKQRSARRPGIRLRAGAIPWLTSGGGGVALAGVL